MGSYDDEYVDDDEYYDDEDEQDEDDESVFSGRPSTNPFSSSGLPGRNRAESASSRRDPKEVAADRSRLFGNRDDGKGGSGESGSGRPSPFGGGSSGSSSRFSSGSSFGGGRSSVPRPGEGDKDKDKDKDSGGSSPRPFSGGARTFGSGGSSSGDAGSGSSSSRFGGGSSSSSSGSSGRPSFSSGSSSGGSSGSSSSRFGGGSGPSSGSGSSGSRFGGGSSSGGDKPDDRSSSSSRPFGSSGSSDDKKDDKKDDKSSGGSRSNFGNRGGSGDKKDDKKKDDKSAGGGGGPLGRFRKSDSGDKGGKSDGKDNKSSGGGSPFQRGKSSGDSGDRKSTGDGGGGVAGAVAGLAGRFRRGGSDDKKGDRSKAPKEKSSGGGPLGRLRGGDKDSRGGGAAASSAPGGSGVSGSRPGQSAFGASKSSTEAPARGKDKQQKEKSGEGRGLFSRLTERLPFGHRVKEARKARTSKTRASKVPRRSEGEGLSLDDKLDIVGVGLMFGALVLFFSSLSGQQGSITGAINTFFSQLLGWGAIAVPFAMVAVGLWLIVRHFGEEPPEVDPVRISGIVMGYLGLLMILMIVETFVNPFYQMATTETFQLVVERTTIANGDGGGWVGAQLYTLLVTNFGEIPAFFAVLGWLVVSIMLTTRTSAAELAIFVISIWRSLRVSLQRRAQQRRAERLALAESRAPSADQDLTVSRPEPEALPAAAQRNALPEPETRDVPIEERGIPIRIGGQMATVGAENGERAAQAGAPPAAPPPGLPQQQPAAAQEEKSSGLLGGLGRVLPFGGKSDSSEEKQDTNGKDKDKDKENGGLLGGLGRVLPFGGKSQPESEAPAASRSDDQKEKERSGRTGAVAAAAGAAVTVGSALTSSESGDGDRRETAASRPTGAERGPSQRPAASSTQDQPAARSSFGSSTAAPSRSPGLPGNPAQPSRPGTGDGDSGDGEKASPFARPFGSGSSGSRPTPFGERSAAQRFSEIKPADTDSIEDEDDGDEEEATA
ncbi:MAG: DNA translocase FtsK 4TM domain-containing protein, partial [Phototrophicaceae bacterium]